MGIVTVERRNSRMWTPWTKPWIRPWKKVGTQVKVFALWWLQTIKYPPGNVKVFLLPFISGIAWHLLSNPRLKTDNSTRFLPFCAKAWKNPCCFMLNMLILGTRKILDSQSKVLARMKHTVYVWLWQHFDKLDVSSALGFWNVVVFGPNGILLTPGWDLWSLVHICYGSLKAFSHLCSGLGSQIFCAIQKWILPLDDIAPGPQNYSCSS